MTEASREDQSPYDPELLAHIGRAFERTRRRLAERAPTLAEGVDAWMSALTGGAAPETYFTHPDAFPMLLLPWWLEGRLTTERDRAFDDDLVASTIDGYFIVRMIDDLMDADRPPAAAVIPALIAYQAGFLLPYQRHFPPGDPFWTAFTDGALASAEMAAADASLARVDRDRFIAISGRKVTGAKLPITAVCHRYGRPDLLEPWSAFVDRLGCWHQMVNDMRGWSGDLAHHRATYFLTEAATRAARDGTSVSEWVLTVGLDWGETELRRWMSECLVAAGALDCPPLLAYLHDRNAAVAAGWQDLRPSLAAVRRLADAFGAPPPFER